MWCLWCERNSRIFNGEETSIPALKFRFLQALFEWLKASDLISSKSISEMLMLCYFLFCFVVFSLLHTSCVHGVFSINESLTYLSKKKTNVFKVFHILSKLESNQGHVSIFFHPMLGAVYITNCKDNFS
jgi:hypothetical protein